MRCVLLCVFATFLLSLGCAEETSDRPGPTNTATPEALGLPSPTEQPPPSITPSVTTPLPTPQSSTSSCPIADERFCAFATDIERAMAMDGISFIQANFIESSSICPNIDGRCVGEPDGTIVDRGYVVLPDYKSLDIFKSAEELRSTLEELTQVDDVATDEYGDGTWTLYAVLTNSADGLVLVTTTIGPDPIIGDPASARRVFLMHASREGDEWMIGALQTIRSGEYLLLGYDREGVIESWLRWGKE